MVRSYWIGPVVLGLAVTGLAWSQSPTSPPAGEMKERTLTVQETDRPGQKCKLLKSWRLPDGHKAYLVQSLATGEFITLAETTETTGATKAAATKIYHWGEGQTPPLGTPEVPNNALVLGNATPKFYPGKGAAQALTARTDVPQVTDTKASLPLLAATTKQTDNKATQDLNKMMVTSPLPPLHSTLDSKAPTVVALETKMTASPASVTIHTVDGPQANDWRASWGKIDGALNSNAPMPVPMPTTSRVNVIVQAPNSPIPTTAAITSQAPVRSSIQLASNQVDATMATTGPAGDQDSCRPRHGLRGRGRRGRRRLPAECKWSRRRTLSPRRFPTQPQDVGQAQQSAGMMPQQGYASPARQQIISGPPLNQGVSPALGNAFTQTGSERPIPANFGPPAQMPNAFHDGNSAVVAYTMHMPNGQTPSPMERGSVPVRVVAAPNGQGNDSTPHLLAILKDSLYPSQREDAAQALAGRDWHQQPQIADALVKAAKEDPAPMVRAECLRSLAKIKVNTMPVVAACQALKADADPRVRKEAEQTLVVLTKGVANDSTVRPVSVTAPK